MRVIWSVPILNATSDVFIYDRQSGITELVSRASSGDLGNGYSYHACVSADGRYVAFLSDANNLVNGDTNGVTDIFVHDRVSGITERVSVSSGGEQGNMGSSYPSMSSDGRFVAFWTSASNLVSGDTNGKYDVFVHHRQTDVTERVSVSSVGLQGNDDSYWPSVSSNGRFIAFPSKASNLVAGDTNGTGDIFVRDMQNDTTERVSLSSSR